MKRAAATWDRFDIVEAWYLYMTLWHGGQWSVEYRLTGVFHSLRFRPRPSLGMPRDLEGNARAIYDYLVRTKGRWIRDRRT
jgi:hypothetical protein